MPSFSDIAHHAWREKAFATVGLLTLAFYGLMMVTLNGNQPLTLVISTLQTGHWPPDGIIPFFVIPLAILYVKGYQLMRHHPASKALSWLIWLFPVLFSIFLLCMRNYSSGDIWTNIGVGWLQAHYHLDPYKDVITAIPNYKNDPMFIIHFLPHFSIPTAYGPLFAYLSKWLCLLGGGNMVKTWFLFKTVNLLAFFGIGTLLFAGVRKLNNIDPLQAAYLFLWNPLMLIQSIGNGHNDILMALGLTLSVTAMLLGRYWLILPALVLAGMIKYAALMLIPLAAIIIFRKASWKTGLISVLFGALVALPFKAPLVYLPHIWQLQQGLLWRSVIAFLSYMASEFKKIFPMLPLDINNFNTQLFHFFEGMLVVLFCTAVFKMAITKKEEQLPFLYIKNAVALHLVLIFLVSAYFCSWYIGMFFPLALFLPLGSRLRMLTIVLSLTHLLALSSLTVNYFPNHMLPAAMLTILPALVVGFLVNPDEQPA